MEDFVFFSLVPKFPLPLIITVRLAFLQADFILYILRFLTINFKLFSYISGLFLHPFSWQMHNFICLSFGFKTPNIMKSQIFKCFHGSQENKSWEFVSNKRILTQMSEEPLDKEMHVTFFPFTRLSHLRQVALHWGIQSTGVNLLPLPMLTLVVFCRHGSSSG